jgi:hypothetical protein
MAAVAQAETGCSGQFAPEDVVNVLRIGESSR